MSTKVIKLNESLRKEGKTFVCLKNNKSQSLTNFVAKIKEDIAVIDKNGSIEHYYVIDGINSNGVALSKTTIPAAEFDRGEWISKHWGSSAKINMLYQSKALATEAIRLNSGKIPVIERYGYVGFIEKSNEKGYVTSSGCIFANRFDPTLKSLMTGPLENYSISEYSPENGDIKDKINAVFQLMEICQEQRYSLTFLIAYVFRSVLGVFSKNQVSLFIKAETGSFKTSLCLVIQSFFGRTFNSDEIIPTSFNSTATAIEYMTTSIRDGILLVDDFVTSVSNKKNEDTEKADYIFRGSANGTTRARCSSTGQLMDQNKNDASVLVTGEHIPKGAVNSMHHRITYGELERDEILLENLSKAQANASAGVYENVTFLFIQYVLQQFDELNTLIKEKEIYFRDKARKDLGAHLHARQYENAASFMLGIYIFYRFAMHHKVIDKQQFNSFCQNSWSLILSGINNQVVITENQTHHGLLCNYLRSALNSGELYLAKYSAGKSAANSTNKNHPSINKNLGLCIGWYDKKTTSVYISACQEMLAEMFSKVPANLKSILQVNKPTFWSKVKQGGGIVDSDTGKNTIRRKLGSNAEPIRVYYLKIDLQG